MNMTQIRQKPLINKAFFHHNLRNLRCYSRQIDDSCCNINQKIHHDEYCPFFSVGFRPSQQLDVDRLIAEDFEIDEFAKKYGSAPWLATPKYASFIKKLIQSGDYFSVMISDLS